MSTLRQFIEGASHRSEKIFRERGELLPMWHCCRRDGGQHVFGALSQSKDVHVMLIRAYFELNNVVRYCFIDEAWIVAAIDNPTPEQLAAVERAAITGAAASPARQEVVMFTAEDHAEGMLMARRFIIRRPHTPPTLGPLLVDPPGGELEGRMIGLLPRPNTARLQ